MEDLKKLAMFGVANATGEFQVNNYRIPGHVLNKVNEMIAPFKLRSFPVTEVERVRDAIIYIAKQDYKDKKRLLRYKRDWFFFLRILYERGVFMSPTDYAAFRSYLKRIIPNDGLIEFPSISDMCNIGSQFLPFEFPHWAKPEHIRDSDWERILTMMNIFFEKIA